MLNFTALDMTAMAWPQLSLVDISDFLISHCSTPPSSPPINTATSSSSCPPFLLPLSDPDVYSRTRAHYRLTWHLTLWTESEVDQHTGHNVSLCSLWSIRTDLMRCTWAWGVRGIALRMDFTEEDVNQAQARHLHILFSNLVHAISLNRKLTVLFLLYLNDIAPLSTQFSLPLDTNVIDLPQTYQAPCCLRWPQRCLSCEKKSVFPPPGGNGLSLAHHSPCRVALRRVPPPPARQSRDLKYV